MGPDPMCPYRKGETQRDRQVDRSHVTTGRDRSHAATCQGHPGPHDHQKQDKARRTLPTGCGGNRVLPRPWTQALASRTVRDTFPLSWQPQGCCCAPGAPRHVGPPTTQGSLSPGAPAMLCLSPHLGGKRASLNDLCPSHVNLGSTLT